MDLLSSYHSDSESSSSLSGPESEDATEKEEFPEGTSSGNVKSSESLQDKDYFNLCSTSSDDECGKLNRDENDTNTIAFSLSDKPYKPDRQIPEYSDKNLQQNDSVSSNYGKYPKRGISEENFVTDARGETSEASIVHDSLAVKYLDSTRQNSDYNNSATSRKRQKSDYDTEKNCSDCGSMSDNNYEVQSEYSNVENLYGEGCEEEENCDVKMPSDLPKKKVKGFSCHSGAITALRWCVPNHSHLLLSASLDGSLKVWDVLNRTMVQDIRISTSGIKGAQWLPCGTALICGGFDKKIHLFDVNSNTEMMTYSFPSYIFSLEVHPVSHHMFVAGVKDKILAFDMRNNLCEPVRKFESRCGEILDIKFLEDGNEFVCSTDIVSGDSADRTIMAWHFATGAQLSNQIFHERYTCPFLQVEPNYKSFVAQTNGNYIAIFSTQRPYKMNKNKRYEGHKVLGYPIGCDFSANGKFLASGDAEGGLYLYWNHTAHLIKRQNVKMGVPITQVKWHPDMYSMVALSSWDGELQLWQ